MNSRTKLIVGVGTLALAGITFPAAQQSASPLELRSVIAFVSTRDNPDASPVFSGELYVAEYAAGAEPTLRLTNLRRLTDNNFTDAFPALAPGGRQLVFDSNRLFSAPALNTSDLFVMDWDGENLHYLVRGSSATWSADGKNIAYHASASGTGRYIRSDPGSATIDSDIFALNVDDTVNGVATPVNLTNAPEWVDDDPDWSPDGTKIVFTRHLVTDNHNNPLSAEIWVMNADGTGQVQLTQNDEEERGAAWSPDGTRIAFSCRRGTPIQVGGVPTFEICVMNADGSGIARLTFNAIGDLTPTWSPDGQRIVFHAGSQLFEVNANGGVAEQLTIPPGLNLLANWGAILVRPPQPQWPTAR